MAANPDTARKQDIALRLSLAGASPAEIAASTDPETGGPLYGSPAGAAKALKAARKRQESGVETTKPDVLSEEIARLKRLQRAVWPAAMSGDVASVREARMLTMARAQLEGVVKGLPEAEAPTSADPLDELEKRRTERRAAASQ